MILVWCQFPSTGTKTASFQQLLSYWRPSTGYILQRCLGSAWQAWVSAVSRSDPGKCGKSLARSTQKPPSLTILLVTSIDLVMMMMVLALLSWDPSAVHKCNDISRCQTRLLGILRVRKTRTVFPTVYELKKVKLNDVWEGNGHYTWSSSLGALDYQLAVMN